jgi:hypothetical protein
MKRFKRLILVGTGVFYLSIALASVNHGPAAADDKTVIVGNDVGNPVPTVAVGTTVVSGTVNIGNSPTVQASQSGPWTVGLGQGATVGVNGTVNTTADPHLTHLGHPVSDLVRMTPDGGGRFTRDPMVGGPIDPFVVPAGQTLVITDIDGVVQNLNAATLLNLQDVVQPNLLYWTPFSTMVTPDGNGNANIHEHLTTGVVIPAGHTVAYSGISLGPYFHLGGYLVTNP